MIVYTGSRPNDRRVTCSRGASAAVEKAAAAAGPHELPIA